MPTVEDVNAQPFKKVASGAIKVVDGQVRKMVKPTVKAGVARLDPNPYIGKRNPKTGDVDVVPTNNTK